MGVPGLRYEAPEMPLVSFGGGGISFKCTQIFSRPYLKGRSSTVFSTIRLSFSLDKRAKKIVKLGIRSRAKKWCVGRSLKKRGPW